jgi:23S rRNA (uracil1939-C5)-methyltransferase
MTVNPSIWIESLDLEAQGIGRLPENDDVPGKVIFIRGALPTEHVRYQITREKTRFSKAKLTEVIQPAVFRIDPQCAVFGICGGCSMQHLDMRAQIAMKQRVLEDDLWHIGRIRPSEIMRPIIGPSWHYRQRARFSVIDRSIKKGTMLIGFHEHNSSYVTDMLACEVIPRRVSNLLPWLRTLIGALSVRSFVPQIELAIGEIDPQRDLHSETITLVIRHLKPLSEADLTHLRCFADEHQVWIWLQAQGIDSAKPFHPPTGRLFYTLPEFEIEMPFLPTDFTQVNHALNRVLVSKALQLLEPQAHERILDLFCGIGNFTLPIARLAKQAVGVEGLSALIERATNNAVHNALSDKTHFLANDLFTANAQMLASWGNVDRWLIDPPREGAHEVCRALLDLPRNYWPKRIVYVSCNPKTLARDAAILVHEAGYELSKAGIMNMFPHTSHIESLAVFNLNENASC